MYKHRQAMYAKGTREGGSCVSKRTLFSRQMRPISSTGWRTPISLLIIITETMDVSGRMAAFNCCWGEMDDVSMADRALGRAGGA